MASESDPAVLRIGELARRVAASQDLLRAWERRYGLLKPVRSPGGYRLYSGAGKYSALMISAGRLLPVGRMASGVMVGQGRQAGAGSAGIQGRPVSASRSAVILSRPCLAAVET